MKSSIPERHREKVVARYKAGESATAIAFDFGVHRNVVRRLLLHMGVELRGPGAAARLRKLKVEPSSWVRDYEAGQTAEQIARAHNVSKSSVWRHLRGAGVQMRKGGGSGAAHAASMEVPPLGEGERSRGLDRKVLGPILWLAFGDRIEARAVEYKRRVHIGGARMSEDQFRGLLRLGWCEVCGFEDEDSVLTVALTEKGSNARDTWKTT